MKVQMPVQGIFRVFYSWQKDVKGAYWPMRNAICAANGEVAEKLKVAVEIDEATRDVAGSPDIVQSLMAKIRQCDVFVADITPIAWKVNGEDDKIDKKDKGDNDDKGKRTDVKLMPNPNVMFELGLAVALKGWNRIILLRKKDDANHKDMPFDINHNRADVVDVEKNKDLSPHILKPIQEILNSQLEVYPTFFGRDRLDINLRSEKYIPEVYVDDYNYRQAIRLFVDPYTFYAKEIDELSRFSFDILNAGYSEQGKPSFDYDLTGLATDVHKLSFSESNEVFEKLIVRLNAHIETLSQDGNAGYLNSSKLRRRRERYEYLINRIMMVRSDAGQGKTNLICDLVDNILLKRKIPFLWINGGEINPGDFENSFRHKVLHDKYISFDQGIDDIGSLCNRTHKPLIIIIDGLNEISFDVNICNNLNQFLMSLLKHEHVKVILTCREEYFNAYFSDYLFDDVTIVKKRLNNISHNEDKRVALLKSYCKHFNIEMSLNEDDERYLTENMLFLRIFCDVNRDNTITHIDRCKYSLFEAYYKNSLSRVASQLNSYNGRRITKYDVEEIYDAIIALMIERNEEFNLPINDVRNKLNDHTRDIIERFLDENILVKRDIPNAKEVVSFTYDEFRDYLKAKYLVNTILPSDRDKFNKFLDDSPDKSITEGVLPFIFVDAYESQNATAKAIIKTRSWYKNLFALNIWNISKENIEDEDVELAQECIPLYPKRITEWLICRWDCKKYHKLNIHCLLNYVATLDDEQLKKYIITVFPEPERALKAYTYNRHFRWWLLDELEGILHDKEYLLRNDFRFLFELALILTPFSAKAVKITNQYIDDTGDKSIITDMRHKTKSNTLKESLKRWL